MTAIRANDHVARDGDADRDYRTGIVVGLVDDDKADVLFLATRKLGAATHRVPVSELHHIGSPTKEDPSIYVDNRHDSATHFYDPKRGLKVDVFHFHGDPADKVGVNWTAYGTMDPEDTAKYANLLSAAAAYAEKVRAER